MVEIKTTADGTCVRDFDWSGLSHDRDRDGADDLFGRDQVECHPDADPRPTRLPV